MKRIITWKNLIAVIFFLVILVGLRYYLAIANTYGFSSPLTYNVSVVKYAVKDAFKLDLITKAFTSKKVKAEIQKRGINLISYVDLKD